MIQRLNSFAAAIGNTWKTRKKHDDNRPATGPKQTDYTVATRHGNTCRFRKPESVGLGKVRHREFAMASGEMTSDEFRSFLESVFGAASWCRSR